MARDIKAGYSKMAALSNQRHERFAQGLARGLSGDEAYSQAGFAANRGNATRLKANDSVQARVAELQERAAIKTEVTVESIAAQLDEDRALARQLKQVGAAVAATMGKAKLFGLITDKLQGRLTLNDGRADELADDELAHIAGGSRARAATTPGGSSRPH